MNPAIASSEWAELIPKIGIKEANKELDNRTKNVFDGLRQLASVCTADENLTSRLVAQHDVWAPARDQYLRSVLHLAAYEGNTRLVKCLVLAGAEINIQDGIGQTALTLSLHKSHDAAAHFLIDNGSELQPQYFENTVCPLDIAKTKKNVALTEHIEKKLREIEIISTHISAYLNELVDQNTTMESKDQDNAYSRALNINVGDQKNTVTIQGCANSCPDIYGCHTPGAGDFHNRGYVNESVARIAGQGGFWHVVERVMKRPTINPASFKMKFKDNNYNNNEEALYDYEDGLSLAMMKCFEHSDFFPSEKELEECLRENFSHNDILLSKYYKWLEEIIKCPEAQYQAEFANELIPISRWYKESVRHGNGEAIEGVWMLLPALYAQVGKTNYRDESLAHLTNVLAKWPIAYRKMYQRNRTINLDGRLGKQLAGDEWVEDHLVAPVKKYANAQTSFSVLETMSCSSNILEMNRKMYKSREAFDIHRTKKHQKPSSLYDQMKVAQFVIREKWFEASDSSVVKKYPWGDKVFREDETVAANYLNAINKGEQKISSEFVSFLYRKYPNEMSETE